LITHEDLLVTDKNIDGTNNDKVRSDMVYFEGNNGSAVFSLPAMGASGSLSHNNYNNNVSRILDNVIREFIK
jgi:N,N-dimethylformamidase